MALSVDTLYLIAFASKPRPDGIVVFVEDDPGVLDDHFLLDIEASANTAIEKCRMDSTDGRSFALCTDGKHCLGGVPGDVYVEEDIFTVRVLSPMIPDPWLWMPAIGTDTLQLTLYFSLIDEGIEVMPCDDMQPTTADPADDPAKRTVGAFPMTFAFQGTLNPEGGNTGKKVKVIWKTDS